jgi:hypothetical protein
MTEPAEGTPAERQAERQRKIEDLLEQHKAARARRDAAPLGSDPYRAAAEEIARIEVQINGLEEPSHS